MTITEILREALKDPLLKSKYNITDEDIKAASFDTTSNHQIIEVIKSIITLKDRNMGDPQIYRNIKSINFGIKD